MSRFKRLRDWTERLKQMTMDELRQERAYWENRIPYLGHPQARKGVERRVREIDRELDSRQAEE